MTAEDGQTRRVYAIAATRDPRAGLSGLEISHGKLHPFFTPDHGAYQAWVPYSVEGVSFTPYQRVRLRNHPGSRVMRCPAGRPARLFRCRWGRT